MSNKAGKFLFFVLLFISTPAHSKQIVNDITKLNPIEVSDVVVPKTIAELKRLVAKHKGQVSIGGGRYSQGGQTACEDCLFIDMKGLNKIKSLDVKNKKIIVEPGITWREIQEVIDKENLSIKIMQTYSNFTVGGSLSVNAHGRYIGEGAIIKSVESIKIVLADGTEKNASRDENQDIFYSAIGGYGGIGIISEATLYLTENTKIERITKKLPAGEYKKYFSDNIKNSKDIIFHNADIYPPQYNKVNAVSWRVTTKPLTQKERLIRKKELSTFEHLILDWVTNGFLGKQFREYIYDPLINNKQEVVFRNYEASHDVSELEPRSRDRSTYVLQEYFIPVGNFYKFLPKMAEIFRKNQVNVINVSIRHALPDKETILSWSPEEVFSFVIYYEQGTTEKDKEKVKEWTSELIDLAIENNGKYYLPYQIIATKEQFLKAYPNAVKFFEIKKKYDPKYKFRNKLWDKYYLN